MVDDKVGESQEKVALCMRLDCAQEISRRCDRLFEKVRHVTSVVLSSGWRIRKFRAFTQAHVYPTAFLEQTTASTGRSAAKTSLSAAPLFFPISRNDAMPRPQPLPHKKSLSISEFADARIPCQPSTGCPTSGFGLFLRLNVFIDPRHCIQSQSSTMADTNNRRLCSLVLGSEICRTAENEVT